MIYLKFDNLKPEGKPRKRIPITFRKDEKRAGKEKITASSGRTRARKEEKSRIRDGNPEKNPKK